MNSRSYPRRATAVIVWAVVSVSAAAARPAAAQSGPTLPPLSGVFTGLAGDFQQLLSQDSAILLTIGGVVAAASHGSDREISNGFSSARAFEGMFAAGQTLGGARMQAAGALATLAVGRAASNARVTSLGVDLVRAQIVTQTLTTALKGAVQRTRPDGTHYSFPSGHSAVTFASATVVQRHFGWKAGIPAYGLAAYVAASRVQVRRHFLSDVAFGAALGIAAGRSVTFGLGSHRLAVSPSVVPGGAGVQLRLADR